MSDTSTYSNAIEYTKKQLDELLISALWRGEKIVDNVLCKSQEHPDHDINIYYGEAVLPHSPEKLSGVWWNRDTEAMKIASPDILEVEFTDIDEDTRVIYLVKKFPWPMWNRSFVTLWHRYVADDGTIHQIFTVVEHDKYPEQPDKNVRGRCTIGSLSFTPVNDGKITFVKRIIHADPGGSIPTMIVNSHANKQVVGVIQYLRKLAMEARR